MSLSRKTAVVGVYRASDPLRARQDHVTRSWPRACAARSTTPGSRSRTSTASAPPGSGMSGMGIVGLLRLPESDAELCRFDQRSAARSFVAHTAHAAAAIAAGLCEVAVVVYGSTAASRASRSAPAAEAVAAIRCDQYRGALRADHGRLLRDDRAAPHARIRHHAGAARRDRGDDAPARLDESGGQVSRSDHGRGRAGLARDFLAAASARLLHHQRRRRRAGDDLGRARARSEEEAGLYPRRGARPCAIGARVSATSSRSRRRNPAASPSSAPASTHDDIDMAMIYDSFTITVLLHAREPRLLQARRGRRVRVSGGRLRFDGDFPDQHRRWRTVVESSGDARHLSGDRGGQAVARRMRSAPGQGLQARAVRTAPAATLGTRHSGATLILSNQ